MNVVNGVMIAAVLLSPLVALFVERLRRRADRRSERETEVLYDLIRYRSATNNPDQVPESAEGMERALNAIPVVFSSHKDITTAYREFYEATTGKASLEIRNEKLTSLILMICRRLGYKQVQESTVKNILFLR